MVWGDGVTFDHDEFRAAQNEEFDKDDEDLKARTHMRLSPGHEMTIGTDDAWHCLTCESEDEEQP